MPEIPGRRHLAQDWLEHLRDFRQRNCPRLPVSHPLVFFPSQFSLGYGHFPLYMNLAFKYGLFNCDEGNMRSKPFNQAPVMFCIPVWPAVSPWALTAVLPATMPYNFALFLLGLFTPHANPIHQDKLGFPAFPPAWFTTGNASSFHGSPTTTQLSRCEVGACYRFWQEAKRILTMKQRQNQLLPDLYLQARKESYVTVPSYMELCRI